MRAARVFQESVQRPWRTAVLAAVLVTVGLLTPRRVWAAPYDARDEGWEGLRGFVDLARQTLGEARVDVPERLDVDGLGAEDALVLVYPTRAVDAEPLARFMRRGGRVLLLDDYGSGEPLLRHFGLGRVAGPRDPRERLRENPGLPLARPEGAHPAVEGVPSVVLNHPTGLTHPDLSPVLTVRERGSDAVVVVAVAGAVGRGRLLAVSDPSAISNQMLRYAGNRAFARGMLRYAVDDDGWGARGGKVHVIVGAATLEASSEAFAPLRLARDALELLRSGGLPPQAAFALAGVLAVAFGGAAFARAGRPHRGEPPRFVRALPGPAQGGVAGHAAVLAAPSTPPALVALEWGSALEETVAARLGLEALGSPRALLDAAREARLLGAADLEALRRIVLRLGDVQTGMVTGGRDPKKLMTPRELEALAIDARRLLEALAAGAGRGAPAGAEAAS